LGVPINSDNSLESPFDKGGLRGLKTIDLFCGQLQAAVLDSRLRGNDRGGAGCLLLGSGVSVGA